MNYLVCQIKGRQYLIKPDTIFEADKFEIGPDKHFSSENILLWVEDNKVEIGMPFLKRKVDFEIIENVRLPKVRVAKYSAKANSRMTRGQVREISKLKMITNKKV